MSKWKVKVAVVKGDSVYKNSFDLGEATPKMAQMLASSRADEVYNDLAAEFHCPTFIECAYGIFPDMGREEIWNLSDEMLDMIDEEYEHIKSHYLSWALEEVK